MRRFILLQEKGHSRSSQCPPSPGKLKIHIHTYIWVSIGWNSGWVLPTLSLRVIHSSSILISITWTRMQATNENLHLPQIYWFLIIINNISDYFWRYNFSSKLRKRSSFVCRWNLFPKWKFNCSLMDSFVSYICPNAKRLTLIGVVSPECFIP